MTDTHPRNRIFNALVVARLTNRNQLMLGRTKLACSVEFDVYVLESNDRYMQQLYQTNLTGPDDGADDLATIDGLIDMLADRLHAFGAGAHIVTPVVTAWWTHHVTEHTAILAASAHAALPWIDGGVPEFDALGLAYVDNPDLDLDPLYSGVGTY